MASLVNNPVRGNKSRIILIVGFLGAGKTTFLRHIISEKRNMSGTVVIINEFGKIGIDASLIKRQDSEIVELTSGCICCTLAVDLKILLDRIWTQYNPHTIFIEASGVADPHSLISLFNEEETASRIIAYRTVTVLDAGFWEMRSIMGEIFHCQLDPADLILFNKIDLLETDKIKQFLSEVKEVVPQARVIPTIQGRIDLERVLWADQIKSTKSSVGDHSGRHIPHTEDRDFVTFSYQGPIPLNEDCFNKFVRELPLNIFRMKGTVRFPDRTVMINHVGGNNEWIKEDKINETRLVFIGWNISSDDVLEKLNECLLS